MSIYEKINVRKGFTLSVEKRNVESMVELSLKLEKPANCLLHWGLNKRGNNKWILPPADFRPEGTKEFDKNAVQTPFVSSQSEYKTDISIDEESGFSALSFVLFFPDENRWDNNQGRNYTIDLPVAEKPMLSLTDPIDKIMEASYIQEYAIGNEGRLAIGIENGEETAGIVMTTDITGDLLLHWGICKKSSREWLPPPESMFPHGTALFQDKAAQSPFIQAEELKMITLKTVKDEELRGIKFVLFQPETGRWLKNRGGDFYIELSGEGQSEISFDSNILNNISREVVQAEMTKNSWTLMHRFNLCHDLVYNVRRDMDGLALIYVWLRFSAIRQLDWQRRYNTKPRELSHAQDRLTLRLSEIFTSEPSSRELIRLIYTTLGRGGEGQKVRDEILNIMHRHKIKEVAGHFMEEWHQKLHNNTTPDDIVICEAYLAFLRSNGNLKVFYKTCEEAGVTKKRLESFDRPIVTDPEFVPHIKDGLIHDFENYLRILNGVHSSTDLENTLKTAARFLDKETSEVLDYIWKRRKDSKRLIVNLVVKITEARRRLNKILNSDRDAGKVRDILFLDLALEEFFRIVVERNIHEKLSGNQLVELICLVVENLSFDHDNKELTDCFKQWERLKDMSRFKKEWSLHVKSVLDRLRRTLGENIDRFYNLFQSKAESLGKAFEADAWTIELFTEEVVRGRLSFVLSMLLFRLDPILRKTADLGNWQVISSGRGSGRVEVVEALKSIQGKVYEESKVIIADKVAGDEDVPAAVTTVITPDVTDIVSHVSVRARNMGLLFATCYDADIIDKLKSFEGEVMNFSVNAAGEVVFKEGEAEVTEKPVITATVKEETIPREFKGYALSSGSFKEDVVGGKSLNLVKLYGKLPEWINLPASAALPFGVFEKVLEEEQNLDIRENYYRLFEELDNSPREILSQMRECVKSLHHNNELTDTLNSAIKESRLKPIEDWDKAWMCIKSVWASKWNEGAYLSRKAMEISHDNLFMAVLIQEVVEAEYAFVIHTANPVSGNKNELFAEVVLGLGEALVANFPGRALGFVSKKDKPKPKLLAFPNKSIGLFGGGLIFRSDSNGEDLSGYAGAGLYDSIMADPPVEKPLDYTEEPLLWNEIFKNDFLINITRIGAEIEGLLGCPQDIEGVYSKGKFYVVQTRPQVGV